MAINHRKMVMGVIVRGFEHHVAANLSTVASAVYEASTRYLGWDMYDHSCENGASDGASQRRCSPHA